MTYIAISSGEGGSGMTMTITVSAAAQELEVRVDEVYRLIRSGRLKATKVHGKLAIDYESLISHMSTRKGGRKDASGPETA